MCIANSNKYIQPRSEGLVIYKHRAIELEKGKVATMTSANFMQKAQHALGPMRRATMDAFLLGTFIIILTYAATTFPFSFPLMIVFVYALVYLIAVILRLRKAATNSPAVQRQENASPIEYTAFTLVKGWTPDTTRTPPEVY